MAPGGRTGGWENDVRGVMGIRKYSCEFRTTFLVVGRWGDDSTREPPVG